jgi:hypothetical protein
MEKIVATSQQIRSLASCLATYMQNTKFESWDVWIEEFISTPLNEKEYDEVRKLARIYLDRRDSPLIKALK